MARNRLQIGPEVPVHLPIAQKEAIVDQFLKYLRIIGGNDVSSHPALIRLGKHVHRWQQEHEDDQLDLDWERVVDEVLDEMIGECDEATGVVDPEPIPISQPAVEPAPQSEQLHCKVHAEQLAQSQQLDKNNDSAVVCSANRSSV